VTVATFPAEKHVKKCWVPVFGGGNYPSWEFNQQCFPGSGFLNHKTVDHVSHCDSNTHLSWQWAPASMIPAVEFTGRLSGKHDAPTPSNGAIKL
jgi:hypothetical protein